MGFYQKVCGKKILQSLFGFSVFELCVGISIQDLLLRLCEISDHLDLAF